MWYAAHLLGKAPAVFDLVMQIIDDSPSSALLSVCEEIKEARNMGTCSLLDKAGQLPCEGINVFV